ncbi:MAG: sodium:proton antiporter [Planctomycetales bacterium]|nr:sodium:proton antiporter [Planctomycetales bacterium]
MKRRSRSLAEHGSKKLAAAALVLGALCPSVAFAADGHAAESPWADLPFISVAPFVLLLLSIAVFPLAAGHWWEHNRNKGFVSALLSLPLAIYFATAWGDSGQHQLIEKVLEYVSFMALLGSLFIISGGIYVQGSLSGTPIVNTAILGLGAVLANFVGTTGASVLLIRPLLRANARLHRKAHIVVFFIFVVSNCGGLLTPLGDPPLFMGYLHGVPFEWTLRLWKQWLVVNGALLVIFNIWDQISINRDEAEGRDNVLDDVQHHEPLRIHGQHNILLLLGVVATILGAEFLRGAGGGGHNWGQDGCLFGLAAASYFGTRREVHVKNRFSFGPINEVAILFAGIFVTMTPALLILNHYGSRLGVNEPWEFFWVAGTLSSFLDNAPTYLTFAATACGMQNIPFEGHCLADLLARGESSAAILASISSGAVFMGANTYIGNGPNFMVKAIAEENGVKMPGFFGYMAYAGAILIPLFGVVTWLFIV